MQRWPGIGGVLFFMFLFQLPVAAQGEWRLDPFSTKIKWAEDHPQVLVGGGWGYYAAAFRWTNDLRWRNNSSPTQPAYYKTQLRRRITGDWWVGAAGRYAVAPTCDFRWVEVELEKTLTKPLAFRLWGTGEWRHVTHSVTLEDYALKAFGSRLRWRPLVSLQWKGEWTREIKTYPSPVKSSAKTAFSNEMTWRISPHTILGRWAESTRVYPEDAWKNYYHRSFRLEWNWNINEKAFVTANCGYNQQITGSGKEGGKLQLTGILDYPYTRDYKFSCLLSAAKKIAAYDPLLEETADPLPAADLRLGIRWQDYTPPFFLRMELFGEKEEGELTGGWSVRLQGICGRFRWTLGLSPRGGFYPTAEKGYWVEVNYYLD